MFFSVLSKPLYDSLTLLKDTHILDETLFLSSFFPPSHPKPLNSHTGQFFKRILFTSMFTGNIPFKILFLLLKIVSKLKLKG